MIQTSVSVGIAERARHLIWDTFFASAKRGVSFAAHLPWHDDPSTRAVLIDTEEAGLVATAVVRPAPQTDIAMVGFVCVAETMRGRGYGNDLVSAVNAVVDDLGYGAALLWTGKPDFYVRHGYEVISSDTFVQVTRRSPFDPATLAVSATSWPRPAELVGIPAFATEACRLSSDRGEAVIAKGPGGITLIDWHGEAAGIVAMMDAMGYDRWAVNLPSRDSFLDALSASRFEIAIGAGPVTMVRRTHRDVRIDAIPVAGRI